MQQNLIVYICLNKKYLIGSSKKKNYLELNVPSVRFLYKQFVILYESSKLENKQIINIREIRAYTLTSGIQKRILVNIIWKVQLMFNSMPLYLKKNIFS